MAQPAHPKHSQNEFIVAAITGGGLFLSITVAIFSAYGTKDEFLGLGLTSLLYIGIALVVIGAALWLALLRPWENFDDLKTPYYTGHDHHEEHHADDLNIIEGLGPKAQEALVAAGITTFAQLATASVDELNAALDGAKLSRLKPDTWPKQAQYVVDGDVAGFEAYKDKLRAGHDPDA